MYKIYIGTYNGIFIVFPGQELPSLYDHTHTNWYKKAKANPSSLVFMTSGRVVKVVKALQKTEYVYFLLMVFVFSVFCKF